MDGVINAQLMAHHIPGATVAVVKDGKLIFAKGYGYADVDERTRVLANETFFRAGSVSKRFIWTAVMQLAERANWTLMQILMCISRTFRFRLPIPGLSPSKIS